MRADVSDRFVRDSVEAERHCRDFARRHPDAKVAVLRFAPILAIGTDTDKRIPMPAWRSSAGVRIGGGWRRALPPGLAGPTR